MASLRRPSHSDSSPVPGDVLACLDELGVRVLKVVGDEAVALCPNPEHRDRKPSWSMNIEDSQHHCFSCGFQGNMVGLVMVLTGVRGHDAAEWVRARGGRERARLLLERRKAPALPDTRVQVNEASLALLGPAPDWALEHRGFSQASADHYEMGWDLSLNCWVAPIRDAGGKLLGWQNKWDDGSRKPLNHPDSVPKSQTLFGYQQLLASKATTAVLMEPPLDVVRFYEAGHEGGVASYGSIVSDDQVRLLIRAPTVQTIVLALDQDRAGEHGIQSILAKWGNRGHRFRILNYAQTKAKAIGDMSVSEIEYALATVIPSTIYRS